MITLAICGINGKMGNAVYKLAKNNDDFTLLFGVDKNYIGNCDCNVYDSFAGITHSVDVIIDFSSPTALIGLLEYAKINCSAVILATTGYNEKDISLIKKYSESTAIFASQNLSLGIHSVIKACKKINDSLKGFDVEIIEKHHRYKKDCPSGTALKIADGIKKEDKNLSGNSEKKKKTCIPIHSVRGGGIAGEHEVLFMSDSEVISVKHTALNREIFASSALDIARFLKGKPHGLYTMDDYAKYKEI